MLRQVLRWHDEVLHRGRREWLVVPFVYSLAYMLTVTFRLYSGQPGRHILRLNSGLALLERVYIEPDTP